MFKIRSRIERKILNYFFLNEEKRNYVNELARIIEEDAKNVHRILLRLEDTGILTSEFVGKERYFSVNKGNPVYKEYKTIFLKTAGIDELLKKTLKPIKELKEAYIYGSYANKKFASNSDIDLLLVGNHNVITAQRVLNKIQKNIDREINVISITPEEIERRKKNKDQFIKTVFSNKIIKLL